MLWEGLTDAYVKLPMGLTAENLAEQYKISRQDCDSYAFQTQQRWKQGKSAFKGDNFQSFCSVTHQSF